MRHIKNLIIGAVSLIAINAILIPIGLVFELDFSKLCDLVLTINPVLLGVSIALFGIYFAMPIRKDLLEALKREGHYSAIARDILFSILGFAVGLLFSISTFFIKEAMLVIITSISLSLAVGALVTIVLSTISLYLICFTQKTNS